MKKERVELVINDGMVVAKATGKCTETMATQEWNVGDYVGKTARVRLVDIDEGGFGHINFDQLEMWTKEPIVRPGMKCAEITDHFVQRYRRLKSTQEKAQDQTAAYGCRSWLYHVGVVLIFLFLRSIKLF